MPAATEANKVIGTIARTGNSYPHDLGVSVGGAVRQLELREAHSLNGLRPADLGKTLRHIAWGVYALSGGELVSANTSQSACAVSQ